jgi:GH18 family chitinase
MKIKSILIILFLSVNIHVLKSQETDFKVVGYFPNWSVWNNEIQNLDYSKLTHICWAFQNPNANGELIEGNEGLIELVENAHNADIDVLISLGGGAASGSLKNIYFDLISTPEKRASFIHNLANYIKEYNLQGIDVDIEGSAINSDYGFFIQQLVDSLRPKGYYVTAALNGMATDNISDETLQLFDWINIMSYDYTGSWTPNNPGQHSSYNHAVQGIEAYINRGCAPEKLVLGVPFYGHAFNDLIGMDYDNYNVILGNFSDAYLYDKRGNVIYYNGIATIQHKTYLALDKIGGIMIWELTGDVHNEYSLLKAIDDAIQMYNPGNLPPVVDRFSPINDTTINESFINIQAYTTDNDGIYSESQLLVNGITVDETNKEMFVLNAKNLSKGEYEMVIKAIDHQFSAGYDTLNVIVNHELRFPFDSISHDVPGKIEAENYDVGASDLTFKDNSSENTGAQYRADAVDIEVCSDAEGGYNVGWVSSGEWLEYTLNVSNTDYYQFQFRVATTAAGRKLRAEIDGTDVTGIIDIAATGGWQKWANVTSNPVDLTEGAHVLRIYFVTGDINFNYFNIIKNVPESIIKKKDFDVKIYPNPALETLNIETRWGGSFSVLVCDESGKTIISKTFNSLFGRNILNINDLKTGVYIIHIENEAYKTSQVFIKE